jgi:hypothetical protein
MEREVFITVEFNGPKGWEITSRSVPDTTSNRIVAASTVQRLLDEGYEARITYEFKPVS